MIYFLAIISGCVIALSFPKFNLYLLAWIAIVPFLYAIEKSKSARSAGFLGFIFGIALLSINLSWVGVLSNYVGLYAYFGLICFVLFQSIFYAVFAYLSKQLKISLTIWQALLWFVLEIIRGLGPFGVTVGILGLSQTNLLPLIQIASFSTIYGVSFLVILFNIALAKLIIKPPDAKSVGSTEKRKKEPPLSVSGITTRIVSEYLLLIISLLLIIVSLAFGYYELNYNKTRNSNKQITISIIQGNIPQEKKLASQYNQEIFDIHRDLSLQAAKDNPQIIIWPETAILSYIPFDASYLAQIKLMLKKTQSYLIMGSPDHDQSFNAYNTILCFSPTGEIISKYNKQHLVPFGEYLPFKPLSSFILQGTDYFGKDFTAGKNSPPFVINGIRIGSVICFETTLPFFMKNKANEGTDVLLVVTNDAWFKNSSAPYEHFNNAIYRAIENRKYFIQSANTGISGLIDPYGRVLKKLDLNTQGFLTFKVSLP